MNARSESRDSIPAVLAVAFGLLLIVASALMLFGVRIDDVDGGALLAERFASQRLPRGMEVVEALRLAQGEEVVVLSDPASWAERRAEEARTWGKIVSHGGGPESWGGGAGRGGGPPRGRGRPGSRGAGERPGADLPRTDWSDIAVGQAGQLPWEVAFVWYPLRSAERVIGSQFGRRPFGDLREVGPEGGKITIASGPVSWHGYDTQYAIERQFAKIDEKKAFRDTLRLNLTLGTRCCVFYAKWPAGTPGSIEPVSRLLEGFAPISPE